MLALDPRVVGAVWAAFEPKIPVRGVDHHPLRCHRHRIPDRDCFEAILFRLVTGCSWDVAGRLGKGGETTLRARRVSTDIEISPLADIGTPRGRTQEVPADGHGIPRGRPPGSSAKPVASPPCR